MDSIMMTALAINPNRSFFPISDPPLFCFIQKQELSNFILKLTH